MIIPAKIAGQNKNNELELLHFKKKVHKEHRRLQVNGFQ